MNDQLDQYRLAEAGLEIPGFEQDYLNGRLQSKGYIEQFLSPQDQATNILEIGCSWGYFLECVKDFGAYPVGVELNRIRMHYVKSDLNLPCFQYLDELEQTHTSFSKIFAFYSLEYFPDPVNYLKRVFNLLQPGGKLIVLTPNLNDVLKSVWKNPSYEKFFYDECTIGYYSLQAAKKLVAQIQKNTDLTEVVSQQGYSFVNHANWYLNNQPLTTGRVAADEYVSEISSLLNNGGTLGRELSSALDKFDREYREIIEAEGCGNQILMSIRKDTG